MTTPDPVCSLDAKALQERLATIRREILPRVARRERRPEGLLLEHPRFMGWDAVDLDDRD